MTKRLSSPFCALLYVILLAGAAHAGIVSVDLWQFDSYCDSGGTCTVFEPSSWVATIGTIDDSTLSGGYNLVTLPVTGIVLTGLSQYWIGLSTTDSLAMWARQADGTGVGDQYRYNATLGVLDNSYGAYLMTVDDDWGTEFDSIGSGGPPVGQDGILVDSPCASFSTSDFTGLNPSNQANLNSVSLTLIMAPEPGCAWMFGAGLVGLLAWRFRSRVAGRALTATLALAAVMIPGLPAWAQEAEWAQAASRPGIKHHSTEEFSASRAYWTKERMDSAIPAPMPVATFPRVPHQEPSPYIGLLSPALAPGVIPGFDPAAAPVGVTPPPDPGLPTIPPATGTCSSCGDYTCPLINSTFAVPTEYYTSQHPNLPYSAVGKLFFVEPDGHNYVCSGASIGGNAVLTAGHCVSDGKGHFNSNFLFVPDILGTPLGVSTSPDPHLWIGTRAMTFQDYLVNGQTAMGHMGRDVGFVIVQGSLNDVPVSTTLSESVGHLGFAWNQNVAGLTWNVFGYPMASATGEFNGYMMGQTNATTGCRVNLQNPPWVAIGSGMWNGASGSPWVLNFWPTLSKLDANYVGGISTYVGPLFTQVYGPYFDSSVKQMKDVAVAMKP